MSTPYNVPVCPRCHNPIRLFRGAMPSFCPVCGFQLNPHAHPVQYGKNRPPPKPYHYPYSPPKGQTIRTPAQVGELQAPIGPILGDPGTPAMPAPKPPVPIWAIIVPIVVVVVVVVVIIAVVSNKNANSPYYSNSSSGSLYGGGASGSSGSSCTSQGTLPNGCDRCLLGSAAAGNMPYEGITINYSYNDDGTLHESVSGAGIPAMSASGSWYCSNNQFCVSSDYFSGCAPYYLNGSSVSWGDFSYNFSIPNISIP
jgi:hypothetical protein